MPSVDSSDIDQQVVNVLQALAQPTRLRIIELVSSAGPEGVAAGVIAKAVSAPASTLSFHLKELAQAGILEARPQGRFIYYATRAEALRDVARYVARWVPAPPAAEPAAELAARTEPTLKAVKAESAPTPPAPPPAAEAPAAVPDKPGRRGKSGKARKPASDDSQLSIFGE